MRYLLASLVVFGLLLVRLPQALASSQTATTLTLRSVHDESSKRIFSGAVHALMLRAATVNALRALRIPGTLRGNHGAQELDVAIIEMSTRLIGAEVMVSVTLQIVLINSRGEMQATLTNSAKTAVSRESFTAFLAPSLEYDVLSRAVTELVRKIPAQLRSVPTT